MRTLTKTALVLGLAAAAIAAPALARGPGAGWGFGPGFGPGMNPNCPRYEQLAETPRAAVPMGPAYRMQRLRDGTCPRFGGQIATPPAGAVKVPGVCDGTGPWWLDRAPPATPDETE